LHHLLGLAAGEACLGGETVALTQAVGERETQAGDAGAQQRQQAEGEGLVLERAGAPHGADPEGGGRDRHAQGEQDREQAGRSALFLGQRRGWTELRFGHVLGGRRQLQAGRGRRGGGRVGLGGAWRRA